MFLYLITNTVNGKIYVGQTTRSLSVRWYEHCASSRFEDSIVITRAIRQHGISNFSIMCLCCCQTQEELDLAEIFLISLLGANKPSIGYNSCTGGRNGKPSHHICKKISESSRKQRKNPTPAQLAYWESKRGVSKGPLPDFHKLAISRGTTAGWQAENSAQRRDAAAIRISKLNENGLAVFASKKSAEKRLKTEVVC